MKPEMTLFVSRALRPRLWNLSSAGLCPEEYALVGLGALVGALIDKAITKTVTAYENPAGGDAAGSVALTAVLTRSRRGVQVAVGF